MKSSSMNHHEMSSNNTTYNNWLGFSLSPHLKMELSSSPSSVPTTYAMSASPHLNYSPLCYAENATDDFHYSAAPGMPLKSDASLSIMEALSTSQPQGTAPKLEDFLGNAAMEAQQHHYQRNVPLLSSDTLYYTTATERQHPYRSYPCIYQNALVGSGKPEEDATATAFWAQNGLVQSNDGGGSSEGVGVVGCGGEIQSLSLSMSPGSQSSCVTAPSGQISPTGTEYTAAATTVETSKKRGSEKVGQKQTVVHRKSIDTFGQRTSQYRGVTRHRWTGRYEAHLWDNSCKKEGQTRKGRQVYLGGYDMEDKAARSYDLAALKYWGPSTHINFPVENYQKELEEMKNMTRQEYVAHLRRKSSGFSRGASMYRGVTRHHQHGRWQARIGRVAGNKDLYLGTFSTQEEAAEAYDVAAIKFRGVNAVTNFDITRYDVDRIISSNTLLAGELARRNKEILESDATRFDAGGMEPVNLDRSIRDNDHLSLTKLAGAHFSNNPSSLVVASLSSSREDSPERNGSGFKFGGSWFPSAAPMSLPHLPLFSAWANT